MEKKHIIMILAALALIAAITAVYQKVHYSRYSGTDVEQASQMDQEATTLARDGKYDDAIETYNQSLEKIENPMVYYNRGVAYMNKGDNENAIRDFTKAIEIKPDTIFAYNNRAFVYKNIGRFNDAIKDYGVIIKLKTSYPDAYFGRASVYELMGDKDKALADYKKALSLGYEDAKKNIKSLEKK